MARSDMSDLEWEFIKAVLPNKTRGKKRVDDHRIAISNSRLTYPRSCGREAVSSVWNAACSQAINLLSASQ
jgi:transposase